MNAQHARPQACRVFAAELGAYVERSLSDARRAGCEAHLASCAACRALLAGIEATIEACRRAPRPAIDADCARRAIDRAREELVRRGLIAG